MSLAFSFTFLDFLVLKHANCRLTRFKRPAAVKKIDYSPFGGSGRSAMVTGRSGRPAPAPAPSDSRVKLRGQPRSTGAAEPRDGVGRSRGRAMSGDWCRAAGGRGGGGIVITVLW